MKFDMPAQLRVPSPTGVVYVAYHLSVLPSESRVYAHRQQIKIDLLQRQGDGQHLSTWQQRNEWNIIRSPVSCLHVCHSPIKLLTPMVVRLGLSHHRRSPPSLFS